MSYAPALRTSLIGIWDQYEKFSAPPCALAATRALLAGGCVADLLWRGNTDPTTTLLLAGLGLYGGWCSVIAFVVCQRWLSAEQCRPLVRSVDVCAIALLALVDDPFGAHLFLLLSFGFVFASYNGGVGPALLNTIVVAVILGGRWAVKPLAAPLGFLPIAGVRHLSIAHTLIVAATGMLLTWSQQRRRTASAAASATTRLIGSLRPELGVERILRVALAELVRFADARLAVLVLEQRATRRLRVIVSPGCDRDLRVWIRRLPPAFRDTYFFDADAAAIRQGGRGDPTQRTALVEVLSLGTRRYPVPHAFRAAHPFRRLHGFAFQADEDWHGRLFLLDPPNERDRARVRAIAQLLELLVPAVAGISDLQALRRRAAAYERARIGRELHDGIVQQLVSMDIDLELLRRRTPRDGDVAGGLNHIQQRLQGELSKLRVLMQRARSYGIAPGRLPHVLADLVERFERETGIVAQFVWEGERVELPSRLCGELARIVQEALANVRRHSGASHVVVRFGCRGREWDLSIQDDGCGFQAWVPVPPRVDQRLKRLPGVISERVHAIGGSVRLASSVERGARLEISFRR